MTSRLETSPKIALVVEDSPTQATHLQAILVREGRRVLCAMSGRKWERMAQQLHPDVRILDIQMPEIKVLEVCKMLRASAELADITSI